MDANDLTNQMLTAAKGLAGTIWSQMQSYALPELQKIAIQIVAIAENHADYTPAGAKALLDMQVKASIGVIVAMTTLTLLAVQDAINAILDAVRSLVNGAIGFALL